MTKWEDTGLGYYEVVGHIKTPLEMVREFATVMNQPLDQKWCVYNPTLMYEFITENMKSDLENMRFTLIQEEFVEFENESEDPVAALKELADLVYVCYGYAATFGWDLDEALRRVHKSNMSKLGPDGKPVYREDGKVLKGDNYKKPNLEDLV